MLSQGHRAFPAERVSSGAKHAEQPCRLGHPAVAPAAKSLKLPKLRYQLMYEGIQGSEAKAVWRKHLNLGARGLQPDNV